MPCQWYLHRVLLEATGLVELFTRIVFGGKTDKVPRKVITLLKGAQDHGGAKVHIDYIIKEPPGFVADKYVLWFNI